MEFRKKCTHVLRLIVGWFLTALGGISGVSSAVCAFVVLFSGMGIDSFVERLIVFATTSVVTIGFFTIFWLGIRLKNSSLRDKTAPEVKREFAPANQYDTPKKLKQESDKAKEQEIAAEPEEIKKICHDFINGEGRLPRGFSEKYNRTIQGYIFHETPFKEYLDEILKTIDALNDRTGISDWIYFDGHIEINAAIEMITDWVRRHREMNARLRVSKVGFIGLKQYIYCEHKIMVVIENGDDFRNVTERSIASCKAEQISFCTILSECELYDLIEHKVKTIEYVKYPNYHDETYADWWLEDSPAGENIG